MIKVLSIKIYYLKFNLIGIDGLCIMVYKFCKLQANKLKTDVLDFSRLTLIRLKWRWKFDLSMDLKIRNI